MRALGPNPRDVILDCHMTASGSTCLRQVFPRVTTSCPQDPLTLMYQKLAIKLDKCMLRRSRSAALRTALLMACMRVSETEPGDENLCASIESWQGRKGPETMSSKRDQAPHPAIRTPNVRLLRLAAESRPLTPHPNTKMWPNEHRYFEEMHCNNSTGDT